MSEIIEHEGVKYRKVAREAREGDYVVVNSSEDTSQYQNGEVHAIADVQGDMYFLRDIDAEERATFLWGREFAVLEPVPDATMPKLTDAVVGDTVRITSDMFIYDDEYGVGDTFVVVSVWDGATGVDTGCGLELYAEEIEVVREESVYDGLYKSLVEASRGQIELHERNKATDNVNSPSHYTQGRFETIEMIAEVAGGYDDGFTAHCAGTALKYLARAPHKHDEPITDLRKARQYIDFAIEHEEKKRK